MNADGIPSGWATATLPELIGANGLLTDGDWVESEDQDPNGDVRLTQLADVGDGQFRNRSRRFLTKDRAAALGCTFLEKGDVMIARMPDPLGRACIFPGDPRPCVTAVDVCVIRLGHEQMSAQWLMSFINAPAFRSAIAGLQAGSTRKRISKKNLCTISLPVPPTAEQHRIVEAIESYLTRLDDALATLERVRRNLKTYRASVLRAAVEGRLVPTEAELARTEGRDYEPASALLERVLAERRRRREVSGRKSKYQEPIAPETTGLPELPEGWCWARLGHFMAGVEAGKNFKCIERPPGHDEVGVVKVSAVTWGTFNEKESKTCPSSASVNEAHFIRDGDFLFSRANTIELVGACLIVHAITGRLMLSDKILRLRLVGDLDWWLLWVLRSALGRREIERLATGNQESMRNISQASIASIRIPVPPEAECRRIISQISTQMSDAEHLTKTVEADVARCSRLRQAILKWAFEGRLADQDPNDESASALLTRVRAERETAKATTKKRPIHGNGRARATA